MLDARRVNDVERQYAEFDVPALGLGQELVGAAHLAHCRVDSKAPLSQIQGRFFSKSGGGARDQNALCRHAKYPAEPTLLSCALLGSATAMAPESPRKLRACSNRSCGRSMGPKCSLSAIRKAWQLARCVRR